MSNTKAEVLAILEPALEELRLARLIVEGTDDTRRARAAMERVLVAIAEAEAKAAPGRARAAWLKGASRCLGVALEALEKDWHRVTDEDTCEGRALATYSLSARLERARFGVEEFLSKEAGNEGA